MYGFADGPPMLLDQQSADRQRLIAKRECRQANSRATRAANDSWDRVAATAASTADVCRYVALIRICLLQCAHIPAASNELARQPIQQLRMRRRRALRTKVLARLDQSDAKELLPDTIDGDASGQRMIGIDQPAGQFQPVGGGSLAAGVAAIRAPPATSTRDLSGMLYWPRSNRYVSRGCVQFVHHHHGRRRTGLRSLQTVARFLASTVEA